MADVTVISPDGQVGTLPEENLQAALDAGYKQPSGQTVRVISPDGKSGTIPVENLKPALEAGYSQAADTTALAEQAANPAVAEANLAQTGSSEGPTNIPAEASDIDITPGKQIRVVNKQTGTIHEIPAENWDYVKKTDPDFILASDAVRQGKQDEANQQKVDKYIEKYQGQYGAGETFLSQLENTIEGYLSHGAPQAGTFVTPEENEIQSRTETRAFKSVPHKWKYALAADKVPDEDLPAAVAALEQLESGHPRAQLLGTLAGGVADVASSGSLAGELGGLARAGVGAEAATSFAGKALGSLASNAVQSSVLAAPELASKAIIDKDPAGAAESLALMTGGGIVLDGLFGIGGVAKERFKSFGAPDRNDALNTWAQSLGLGKKFQELSEAEKEDLFKGFHNEIGLSVSDAAKMSKNDLAKLIKEKLSGRGEEIGDVYKELDKFKKAEVVAPEAVNALSARDKLIASAQEALSGGGAAKALDEQATRAIQDSVIIPSKSILPQLEKLGIENVGADVTKIASLVKNIETATAKDGSLSFTKAHDIVSDLGKIARKTTDDATAHTYLEMQNIVKTELMNVAERRAAALAKPDLIKELSAASSGYRYLKAVSPKKLQGEGSLEFLQPTANHGGVGIIGREAGRALGAGAGAAVGYFSGDEKEDKWLRTLVGAGVGGLAGTVGAMGLGKYARAYMARTGNRKIAAFLTEPSSAVIQGAAAKQSLMSKLPQYVKLLSQEASNRAVMEHLDLTKKQDSIKNLLGDTGFGLSNQERTELVQKAVHRLANNPDVWEQQKAQLLDGFDKYPQLQKAMSAHFDAVLSTLAQFIPQNREQSALPFQSKKSLKLSAPEQDKVLTVLHYAEHPQAILADLHAERITPEKVAMAMKLNPAIMGEIRNEIVKQGFNDKVDMPYSKALQLSIFLGQNVAQGLDNTQNFQQAWAAGNTVAPEQPAPKQKGHVGHKINPQQPSMATTFQRLGQPQ